MQQKNFDTTFDIVSKHLGGSVDDYVLIDIAFKLEPFTKKLVELNNLFTGEHRPVVKSTILHDYYGLNSRDSHFCPRLG